MPFVSSPRRTVIAVITGVTVLGSSFAFATAAASTPNPPTTVRATRITRQSGTLAPGTHVRSGDVVGQRTFTDGTRGFGLASVGGADYPVTTTDAGKTWKTDGPALHLHAAQAPLAVAFIGVVNRKRVFAWGGGGQVIDTTNDGGKSWYRMERPRGRGHLIAWVCPTGREGCGVHAEDTSAVRRAVPP
jgi:hypothetical protein